MQLMTYQAFRNQLRQFLADRPDSPWKPLGCERRIYATLNQICRYFPRGCKMVDFGCLPVNMVMGLIAAGLVDKYDYTGICSETPDHPDYQWATRLNINLQAVNLDPCFHLFPQVSALPPQCPLPAGSVDLVLATEILEHLAWPHSMLQEAARLLRPGGLLLGSTPNATNIGVVAKSFLGIGAFENYPASHLASRNWMKHVRFYSARDLKSLLAEHPFDPLRIEYHTYWNLYPGPTLQCQLRRWARAPFYLVPHWRESLFFAARRL